MRPTRIQLQIKPGVFILVTPALRKTAGEKAEARLKQMTAREKPRPKQKRRLYSDLIIAEALELARIMGVREASKKTGVGYWTIVEEKRLLKLQGKYTPRPKPRSHCRYTPEQKQACVRLAKQIVATEGMGVGDAFAEAGRRMGVNGRSIAFMYSKGYLTPNIPPSSPAAGSIPPAQRPSGAPCTPPRPESGQR